MKAFASSFEHRCSEHTCGGDLLESNENGVKLVRKTMLRDEAGRLLFMGSLAEAEAFAEAHAIDSIEVVWP